MILNIFIKKIREWFRDTSANDGKRLEEFCNAFLEKNTEKIEQLFGEYLWNTISIRDTAVAKEKKENFSCDVVNYFYEIINKAKKGRNNFIFSNKEINYDNSSNQLLKLGYKSCDSKFFENINVSESSVHKDIDLDLQKELEKKFDELFGSLDEDETNIKEENSQQENLSKDDNVIVLNDEDGNDIKFDFLDLIEYDGDEFVVLLPSDENADEVVILKVEDGETEDTESYVSVDDDLVLNNVFSIFKERFKEEFHFCESNE